MRRDMKGWQHLWTTLPHVLRLDASPNQRNSLHKRESQNLKEEEEEEEEKKKSGLIETLWRRLRVSLYQDFNFVPDKHPRVQSQLCCHADG